MLLDDIIIEIGEFKTYQIVAYAMLNFVSIMTGESKLLLYVISRIYLNV